MLSSYHHQRQHHHHHTLRHSLSLSPLNPGHLSAAFALVFAASAPRTANANDDEDDDDGDDDDGDDDDDDDDNIYDGDVLVLVVNHGDNYDEWEFWFIIWDMIHTSNNAPFSSSTNVWLLLRMDPYGPLMVVIMMIVVVMGAHTHMRTRTHTNTHTNAHVKAHT